MHPTAAIVTEQGTKVAITSDFCDGLDFDSYRLTLATTQTITLSRGTAPNKDIYVILTNNTNYTGLAVDIFPFSLSMPPGVYIVRIYNYSTTPGAYVLNIKGTNIVEYNPQVVIDADTNQIDVSCTGCQWNFAVVGNGKTAVRYNRLGTETSFTTPMLSGGTGVTTVTFWNEVFLRPNKPESQWFIAGDAQSTFALPELDQLQIPYIRKN
jgi:hypothetical protein